MRCAAEELVYHLQTGPMAGSICYTPWQLSQHNTAYVWNFVFTVVLYREQVQRKPDNVDAWRLLGTVHAENDDDTQAIAAMAHALKADPTNAEVGHCVSCQ